MSLIPIYSDFSFSSNQNDCRKRFNEINQLFESRFESKPSFYTRAPGRVNFIGDHIDCNHFSSLPMAIQADMTAAVSIRTDQLIKISNLDSKFEDSSFEIPQNGQFTIDKTIFSWTNYVKCGFLVASNFLKENSPNSAITLNGLNVLFHGTVPSGGGLSSSASICVCSALLFLRANGMSKITKKDLTKISVVSEHYLGVNTGGLDQCASIYGEDSKALLVHYKPDIHGETFSFPNIKPSPMKILISNTLVEANKFETAPVNYNLRVVEFAVASEILAVRTGFDLPKDSNLKTATLKGFLDTYLEKKLGWAHWDGHNVSHALKYFAKGLELIEQLFDENEKKNGFTTEEAAKALNISTDEFASRFLASFPVRYEKLKLYKRSKHVYFESLNVFKVIELLTSNNTTNDFKFMENLGSIINDSQQTSITGIENSTPEIEIVCEIALKNGSYGSRVTGAGWGGCVIHITTEDKIEKLYTALSEEYYKKRFPGISENELKDALIITQPSSGALLIEL